MHQLRIDYIEFAQTLKGCQVKSFKKDTIMFEDQIITTPTRELSNTIVITAKKDRPVRLQLNGKEMFFDTDPYFSNSKTMVPLRGVMEAVGADASFMPIPNNIQKIGETATTLSLNIPVTQ